MYRATTRRKNKTGLLVAKQAGRFLTVEHGLLTPFQRNLHRDELGFGRHFVALPQQALLR